MLRGRMHLCQYMPRCKDARRLEADPANEPDFYKISDRYPVNEVPPPVAFESKLPTRHGNSHLTALGVAVAPLSRETVDRTEVAQKSEPGMAHLLLALRRSQAMQSNSVALSQLTSPTVASQPSVEQLAALVARPRSGSSSIARSPKPSPDMIQAILQGSVRAPPTLPAPRSHPSEVSLLPGNNSVLSNLLPLLSPTRTAPSNAGLLQLLQMRQERDEAVQLALMLAMNQNRP